MTPELHKALLQAYYASISCMDAQVGRALDALKEKGLADNTIVVFTWDHDYLLGHHHKYQKQHLFEEATRVPFIISVPWLKDQVGRGNTKTTERVDPYPTLAELAGLPAPDTLQGANLKPLLADTQSPSWKQEQAFTISRGGGEFIPTADWRFTQWGFGEKGRKLYDLKKRPRRIHKPGKKSIVCLGGEDAPDATDRQTRCSRLQAESGSDFRQAWQHQTNEVITMAGVSSGCK
ncbi:Arylsulfatase [Planctomycetes bacterium CA13]|uniref:Arylsulfatase n=1 Tax=Novipirellula herctigrandis TaxID=2527986 RepID=A0A5C5ZDL8_9BACT|nr:Arylsulfatase [Planctomycetes bacterium CA13]